MCSTWRTDLIAMTKHFLRVEPNTSAFFYPVQLFCCTALLFIRYHFPAALYYFTCILNFRLKCCQCEMKFVIWISSVDCTSCSEKHGVTAGGLWGHVPPTARRSSKHSGGKRALEPARAPHCSMIKAVLARWLTWGESQTPPCLHALWDYGVWLSTSVKELNRPVIVNVGNLCVFKEKYVLLCLFKEKWKLLPAFLKVNVMSSYSCLK